jgi:hypothetical protein
MASIDVISLIFESFEFIRAHYKEVAFPLVVLLLLSGTGSYGGSSLSDMLGERQYRDGYGYEQGNLQNALSSSKSMIAYLAGMLAVVVAIAIAVAFVIAVISTSIWFYISEHFYTILKKRKITEEWQGRMKRHLPKAFILTLLEFFMFAAFAIAILACISFIPTSWFWAAVLLLIVVILGLNLGFYLIPLWMYYVLDNLPFFESLSRSAVLVFRNVLHFAIFAIIFVFLTIAALFGSFTACCFSFIIAPLLFVFISLLSRVTLIKMKLAIEAQERK